VEEEIKNPALRKSSRRGGDKNKRRRARFLFDCEIKKEIKEKRGWTPPFFYLNLN